MLAGAWMLDDDDDDDESLGLNNIGGKKSQ